MLAQLNVDVFSRQHYSEWHLEVSGCGLSQRLMGLPDGLADRTSSPSFSSPPAAAVKLWWSS